MSTISININYTTIQCDAYFVNSQMTMNINSFNNTLTMITDSFNDMSTVVDSCYSAPFGMLFYFIFLFTEMLLNILYHRQ